MYTDLMHTIFLALGSNVGNKKKHIKQAVTTLGKHVSDIQVAKFYETKPMYYEEQDMFINTALKGQTLLSPQELIAFVKLSEEALGRQKRFSNGPREIDIDILFYDQLIYESITLTIPHPRISERAFVLEPLTELDPNFVHPLLGKTMKELLKLITKSEK